MKVPGKNVSTTSGRVSRTIRTSCSSAAPCCQFASDTSTSCPAVSFPSRNQTFVIPKVAFARRASISRITAKPAACSVPTSFPPLPPRVPYTTATRFPSSIARARYAVAAPSSSGCATTKRMSALYRASGSRSSTTAGAFAPAALAGSCARAIPTHANSAQNIAYISPLIRLRFILFTPTKLTSPSPHRYRLKRKSVPRQPQNPTAPNAQSPLRLSVFGCRTLGCFQGAGLDETNPIT